MANGMQYARRAALGRAYTSTMAGLPNARRLGKLAKRAQGGGAVSTPEATTPTAVVRKRVMDRLTGGPSLSGLV